MTHEPLRTLLVDASPGARFTAAVREELHSGRGKWLVDQKQGDEPTIRSRRDSSQRCSSERAWQDGLWWGRTRALVLPVLVLRVSREGDVNFHVSA